VGRKVGSSRSLFPTLSTLGTGQATRMPIEPTQLVAKLLALALDQAGMPEGELARQKAEELMARHGITKEDVSAAEARFLVREKVITIPRCDWAIDLLASLCYACSCVSIRQGSQALIFGRFFHVEVAALFYEQVLRQLDEELRTINGAGLWSVDKIEDWRASFVLGVSEKLKEQEMQASFKSKEVCVDAACSVLRDRFPNCFRLMSYSLTRNRIPSAFEAGADVTLRGGLGSPALQIGESLGQEGESSGGC